MAKDMEERFDKEFEYIQDSLDEYFEEHFGSCEGKELAKIKSFIKSELLALLDRVEKVIGDNEIEGMYPCGVEKNKLRTQQRAALKKIREELANPQRVRRIK